MGLPAPHRPAPGARPRRLRRARRWAWRRRLEWTAGAALILLILATAASRLADEPLRRAVEGQMNRRLKGYSARIERVHFHPLGFSLTLYGLAMTQDAHPHPPVLRVPVLTASVHWRALLHGRLVATFDLDRPELYADRTHAVAEARDPTPLAEHGWQDAFEAIYPLKINRVSINDGGITYVDRGPFEPLRLRHVDIVATNIRNVRSREREYPSDLHLDAVVFDRGALAVDGHADFLAKPQPGVKANITMQDVDLAYFKPIVDRYHVALSAGTLFAAGEVEYGRTVRTVHLREALLRDVRLDYVHVPANAGEAARAATTTLRSTKEVTDAPDLLLRADAIRVEHATLGLVNRAKSQPYRLYLADARIVLSDFTNRSGDAPARLRVSGKFMGSGPTAVDATFRPHSARPDLDVTVQVEDADLTALNDVLRAYGDVDVASGLFSLYSELHVKNDRIAGYVKPLLRDVRAYDREKDRGTSFGHRLKERAVDLLARLLKNRPRKEVATRAEVSGSLADPKASRWQVVARLLKNAFIKAIRPGLDRSAGGEAAPPT